jgi:G:T/U-mismatch repair DNA glycosylase
MAIVKHRFLSHTINPDTETLVVGTFNPDTPENIADFYYGRQRNYLWTLIPAAFGDPSLKGKTKDAKLAYAKERKIDFIDLIASVDVEDESNYDDDYLDGKIATWRDVITEIEKLKNLKRVCFSRKTFAGIPKMKERIESIRSFCEKWGIGFSYLTTPARFYNNEKQTEWTAFFNPQTFRASRFTSDGSDITIIKK